jgi:UDP-3-O-[3-hydroxymyristoyl] glucosamine N-acyltransferase
MMTLHSLAAALRLEIRSASRNASGDVEISGVSSISSADRGSLVFATDPAMTAAALSSAAAGVILPERLLDDSQQSGLKTAKPVLLSANPRLDFARAARLLRERPRVSGIHPKASIAASAILAEAVSAAAFVVIEAGAAIGAGTVLGAGAVIGEGVSIGADCHIYPRVVIYPGTRIGDRVIVHAGAVLGSDGFGYVRDPASGEYLQSPQQGRLVIEDDVEIGANTTIDRGALDATVVGRGTKLDNLVHLGHNVRIGRNTVIASQTGISGSSTVGDNVMLGGQVGMGDHAHVGDGVILGGQGGVLPGKTLKGAGVVFWGTPAQPVKDVLKELGLLRRLRRAGKNVEP